MLAIDIGGTKMAVGVATDTGDLVAHDEIATPPGGSAETLWHALRDAATAIVAETSPPTPVQAVGVGCGGPMRWPSGEVSPLNIPGWRGFPLRERLRQQWPGVPVAVHNDAIAFALGEARSGAARGWRNVLGVVVSTGVGGGLILDGAPRSGPSGNAGHIGHLVVDPQGPPCGCGGHGCVEAIARGPAVVEWALRQGWQPPAPKEPHTGSDRRAATDPAATEPLAAAPATDPPAADRMPTGRELAAAATAGDVVARAAFARAGRAVGLGIVGAAALLDLDVVVVGGGMAAAGDLLFGPMRAAIAEHARLAFTSRLVVLPSELGRQAGLVGAAALVTPSPAP